MTSGCLFMPQVLHLTTSSTGSHCIHSLTNSASIQSTDIDSGLNTRLPKYSFTLFSLLSSFNLPNSSSFPFSAGPYFVHSICSRASDYLLFPSPLAPPASSAACAPAPSSGWIPAVRTIVPRSHLLVATGTPSLQVSRLNNQLPVAAL
ncbi:hypothetical protein BO79DRAFT_226390 [Aspergillus costaricaensis CBS 115574]|uniref:Uncharacterized protein n=1 Tax=Aspergillus costaricaensis CBS 115574 TaxID=1448317 RepID=A0ACD1IL89_9EURO|nr:hypothetical protein BO79DRAFT_226390 [Aspergillus costaricaensis CBS 115574]RAK91257.1 hypothetical protein BO79DRAFT_226390 [Aspergillus costaricaensis CBS 115574]